MSSMAPNSVLEVSTIEKEDEEVTIIQKKLDAGALFVLKSRGMYRYIHKHTHEAFS